MARQIVLDTETTGIDPKDGHRIVEIGALVLENRRPTKEVFHHYLNPDKQMDEEVMQIHGIRNEFLQDKPRFADIVDDLMQFISGAELIIHNASFDLGHLNAELARLPNTQWTSIEAVAKVTDSLAMAKKRFPGQKNSLDALCKRLGVDNSGRVFHGALLDSEILADVYLMLTGGQTALGWEMSTEQKQQQTDQYAIDPQMIAAMKAFRPTPETRTAHLGLLQQMGKKSCLWLETYPHG